MQATVAMQADQSTTDFCYPSWKDLPDPLTEMILERLPLSDYIRFAAVCRNWRSIQRDHRLRHAPSPPPMLRLPLLIPCQQQKDNLMVCYSPLERRFYRFQPPTSRRRSRIFISSHGWLLLLDPDDTSATHMFFTLVNPVSRCQIKLPPLVKYISPPFFGCMSSSPPDDPRCVVMVISSCAFLWRAGDRAWIRLPYDQLHINSIIFCAGKFYCNYSDGSMFALDPTQLPYPEFHPLFIDPLPPAPDILVDSNGEILLVRAVTDGCLQVFKADLSKKMWVRVESLGDRVLFLGRNCSVSMLAADVGVREEGIYIPHRLFYDTMMMLSTDRNYDNTPWKRFELKSGRVIDGEPVDDDDAAKYVCSQFRRYGLRWIFPTLAAESGSSPVEKILESSCSLY